MYWKYTVQIYVLKVQIYWKCTVQICKSYISIESTLYKYIKVTYLLKVHCTNISKLHIYWKYTVHIYQSYISIESTLYKYFKGTIKSIHRTTQTILELGCLAGIFYYFMKLFTRLYSEYRVFRNKAKEVDLAGL